MEVNSAKEVYFDEYCPKCAFAGLEEWQDPCDECLAETTNEYSHKPVKWKEGYKNGKRKTE